MTAMSLGEGVDEGLAVSGAGRICLIILTVVIIVVGATGTAASQIQPSYDRLENRFQIWTSFY